MDYLSEGQIKSAMNTIENIKDNLKAVKKELLSGHKPYKNYLNEKLETIRWEVDFLLNLSKPDIYIKVDDNIKLVLQNLLDDISNRCRSVEIWDEDLFPSSDWNDLWHLTERVINTSKITEQQSDILVHIDNIINERIFDGFKPVDPNLHSRFVDIMNYVLREIMLLDVDD